uniref:Histone deacetylase domain-containing protein n=1 Tax=viral metagenome TaxID=1070528 RepID=A0A6C0AF13_9ZZZZ
MFNNIVVLTHNILETEDVTTSNNKPQLRHKNIIGLLKENNIKINFFTDEIPIFDISSLNIIDKDMLEFFRNCYNSYEGTKDKAYVDEFVGIVPCNVLKGKILFDYSKMLSWKQVGIWCEDTVTPIKTDTFSQIMKSAYNSFRVDEFINEYNLIYILNSIPGHHASYNSYGGYCYINNASICAKKLLSVNLDGKKIEKIAILDLDHHAGNGTESIFLDDENVMAISIHANPLYDYPFYSGHTSKYNLTFDPDVTIEKYFKLLEDAMQLICDFDPQVLIIPFGTDTYKDDPEASESCKCCLDIPDYFKISKYIKSRFSGKVVVTQEGGYDMNSVGNIVVSFLSGF